MVFDRLILSAVLGTAGWNGMFPEPPAPPTPPTLHARAVHKSMSNMCAKKKHGKQAKELCKQWKEKQNA